MMEKIIESFLQASSDADKQKAMDDIIAHINAGNTITSDSVIGKLVELLDDANDFIRIKATELSEFFKSEALIDKLIEKMLSDTNYFVRGFSAKALGSIGNMKAKPSLEKALLDKEGFVVSYANKSLKNINIKVSFSNKLQMLKDKMKERAAK